MRKFLIIGFLLLLLKPVALLAQGPANDPVDSLARLISAKSMELIEKNGRTYRKVTGPARFLHNNTYLICDTAQWYVDEKLIRAKGRVKLIQAGTTLSSDSLDYRIDYDLAQFRGALVQLEDKEHNTLRTSYLDYNTKDSVAVFTKGGAMRDKDGQIIESENGKYDAKLKTFEFSNNVNMFTDSVLVKTTMLTYYADKDLAKFGLMTSAWRDDGMLTAQDGWYDRPKDLFFFCDRVHAMNTDKEAWCDSLYLNRAREDVEMLGNVQLTDSLRQVSALAGRIVYVDSLSEVTMLRKPAVIAVSEDDRGRVDTVYVCGDSLAYRSLMRLQISEEAFSAAKARLEGLETDPIRTYREKQEEEAEQKRQEYLKNDPNRPPDPRGSKSFDNGGASGDIPQEEMEGYGADMDLTGEAESASNEKAHDAADSTPKRSGPPPMGPPENETPADSSAVSSVVGALASASDSLNLSTTDSTALVGSRSLVDSTIAALPDSAMASQPDSAAAATSSLGDVTTASNPSADGAAPMALKDSLSIMAADTLSAMLPASDSLSTLTAAADSLSAAADSLAKVVYTAEDSVKLGFLTAVGKVKLFRRDMQMACDSLRYSDIDSLVRLYRNPLIWNETVRQYSADSLYGVIRNSRMEKASLMSNSFIVIQEDTLCFDQIRSTEMMAYFDTTSALVRFDALGEVSTVFYLKEDSTFATVNKSQAKMFQAIFKDGNIDTVYSIEEATDAAYPLAQMTKEERLIKGFKWNPELRPKSPLDITTRHLKPSEKTRYRQYLKPDYTRTAVYFPGYMDKVFKEMSERKAKRRVRRASADTLSTAGADSVFVTDSLHARVDSLGMAVDSLGVVRDSLLAASDSLALGLDSLSVAVKDSLSSVADSVKTVAVNTSSSDVPVSNPKALKKAEKEKRKKAKADAKAAKIAAREQKWARLDSLDAQKARLKLEKKQAKEREKKRKTLEAAQRQREKDEALFQRYKEAYEKRKEADQKRKASQKREEAKTAEMIDFDTAVQKRTKRKADVDS